MTDSIMDADSTEITGGVTTATPPAISIQNAYKRYSVTNIVLHGLNLTVPDKSIYALLGPSGCGKTTLLNCIVGKTELDSGAIKLNVKRRMDIGYMPQTLSLYDQMTVNENFYFYGLLYHMSDTEIRKRSDDLISFLELPSGGRFVASLSGGQQRRVSIAVALIHDPKIIILDEPTVGLDPLLNHSIWNRLLEMANKGKSIVITTHYIQEARQAHTIGLMREGKLLAEEPPLQLMEKHCCSDLEAAFLKLSHKQDVGMRQQADQDEYPEKSKKVKAYYEDDERMFSLDKFTGIMYKNVTFLRRENVFLAFLIILPILQSYLFNVAIGGKPKHMNLAVINEEMPAADCSPSRYNGCILSEDDIYNENITLSCMFLDYLKNATYNFIEFKNDSEALDAVRKNEVWALLHFTHNYSISLAYRISYGASIHEEDLESGIVDAWIDLSNKYIGSLVKLDIAKTMYALLRRMLSDCGLNPKLGSVPVQFEKPVFGSFNGSFLGYASNAMLCLTCFFLPMILSAGLMLTEKIGGMMERMMVAGVTITEIILSATIIQIVVHFIQTSLVMIVIYWWFDNPLEGSIVTLSFLLLLTGICGMFFGFAVAVSNSDMMRSSYIGIGINLALCFTTGLLWPIDAAHYILRMISPLVPLTHTVDAVRAICAKNLSFFHPLVFRGFASTTVWMLIVFVIMCLFIRYKKDGLTVHK